MNNKKVLIGRILSVVICLPFIFSAISKIFWPHMYPEMPEAMAKMGFAMEILPKLAALEIMCIIVYLIPVTAVLGAVLFTGYLGGAILTHMRIGEPVFVPLLIGGFVWLGIYLREPRLHAILPIRKK
jgi:hypothetical protein